ncbi:hypothetical protein [Desulfuribacillus alkaliarsenatis]|uniref:Uncharacterized protein n=1 Tax=Desulfuribacillus alkaliarsenatis TaxID=766136 RepID=A0A1E5G2S5_9FIRM|nr:hypothetical protein [Desulfuribacillus alkaliarsenatis]OEF96831.1 hypothetical protein BHF68_07160 [Desulfuribacillus alkaliarsenatis]
MSEQIDFQLPICYIDLMLGEGGCILDEGCKWYKEQMYEKLVGRYIGLGEPFDKQIVAAMLNVNKLNFEEYIQKVKKKNKGSALRHAKKSERKGYICKPFAYDLFIPDIVEINHSKEMRCGRPMTEQYRRSIDELGGAPEKYIDVKLPNCPVHYDMWWGVFQPLTGYKQGDIVTNEKLLGYIRLRRNGNYALYAQILGHGEYLKQGIMYYLHFDIMRSISDLKNIYTKGLEHLIYAGFYQGKEGLQQWKKKMLFEPTYLILPKRE